MIVMRRLVATRKRRVLTAVAVLALAATGAAIAQWLTSGRGTATSQIGTLQQITFAQASPFTGTQLLPGGTGDLQSVVTNPNPSAVTITSVSSDTTVTVDNPNGWSAADLDGGDCSGSYATVSASSLNVSVPPGTSTVTVPNAVHLGLSAPSSCQGHHLKLWVTATVQTA